MIRTIGELKELIKDLPDDMAIGGYNGGDYIDYIGVDFYIVDRSEDEDWDKWKKDETMKNWWKDIQVPDKVFVCDTD